MYIKAEFLKGFNHLNGIFWIVNNWFHVFIRKCYILYFMSVALSVARLILNGFFIRYCNSQRQIVLNENPGITHQDLTKLISVNWNNLDMEEKQVTISTLGRRIEINSGYTFDGPCMAIETYYVIIK